MWFFNFFIKDLKSIFGENLTSKTSIIVQKEENDRIYSKRVRAGKRTYFFDVRSTRSSDYYLTITESRRSQREGEFVFEKSKMFVYKEDFEKFVLALQETVDHIKTELMPDVDFSQFNDEEYGREERSASSRTDISLPLVASSEGDEDAFGGTDLKWE